MFSSPVSSSPQRRISSSTTPTGSSPIPSRRRSSDDTADPSIIDISSSALSQALSAAFEQYSSLSRSTGPGLDSMRFRKLCIDAGLFDKKFTPADADLLYTKANSKECVSNSTSARRRAKLNFDQFKGLVIDVAVRRGEPVSIVSGAIYNASKLGPTITGTLAETNRFHDDPQTYTGVHKKGGPTIIDRDKPTLDRLLDRSSADIRGRKKEMVEAHGRDLHLIALEQSALRRASAVMGDQVGPRTPTSYKQIPVSSARPTDYDSMSNDDFFSSHDEAYNQNLGSRSIQYDRSVSSDGRQGGPVMRHSASMPLSAEQNRKANLLRSTSMGQPSVNFATGFDERYNEVLDSSRAQDIDEELFHTFSAHCSNKIHERMDLNSFITFVARSELLSDPSRLTQPDCQAIYNVAVPPMEEGMTYDCFRSIAVPALANRLRTDVRSLTSHIIESSYAQQSNIIEVEPNARFNENRHVSFAPMYSPAMDAPPVAAINGATGYSGPNPGYSNASYNNQIHSPYAHIAGAVAGYDRPGSQGTAGIVYNNISQPVYTDMHPAYLPPAPVLVHHPVAMNIAYPLHHNHNYVAPPTAPMASPHNGESFSTVALSSEPMMNAQPSGPVGAGYSRGQPQPFASSFSS